MTALALSARRWGDTARLRAAAAAGHAVRVLGVAGKTVPGIVGPIMICVGLGMLAPWLGVVAGGVALLALDRRIP